MMRIINFGVVVVLLALGGCASPTGPSAVTLSNCDGITLQKSCPQNQPVPVANITVPTDTVRIADLPASVQLTELTRVSSGLVWRIRTLVERYSTNPNDGCEYRFYTSEDGENPIKTFGGSWTLVGTGQSLPDGSPDSVSFALGSFRYILVESRCFQSGVGWGPTGKTRWEVNIVQ